MFFRTWTAVTMNRKVERGGGKRWMQSVLSLPRRDFGENRCQNFLTRKQAPASILKVIFLEENPNGY
jgi:hypothetical protein